MPSPSLIISVVLLLAVAIWMASGVLLDKEGRPLDRPADQDQPPLVETALSTARPITRYLVLPGEAVPFRTLTVRAETTGRVAAILIREGKTVREGELLFRLTLEAREEQRREIKARIESVQSQLEGARELAGEGYTPCQRVSDLEAQLAAAVARLSRLQEEIADTRVTAPFRGVVNEIAAEPGQFVVPGEQLATLLDSTPLKVSVNVAQQDIRQVEARSVARVAFATGQQAFGRVCFISAAAAPDTRTFAVEVEVANAERSIPSGISAEVRLPVSEVMAHFVSPAILSLNDEGVLGLKAVGPGDEVVFHPGEIVRTGRGGVWISGPPLELRVITIGQGFVTPGEKVRSADRRDTPDAEDQLARPAIVMLPDAANQGQSDAGVSSAPETCAAASSARAGQAEQREQAGATP